MIRISPIVVLVLLTALVMPGFARGQSPLGLVAEHQAMLDAGTDLRLLCIAGHPDDEDGGTLAKYRKKYGYHTTALIVTRGEGGQNEIGPELYEELAVIRTYEQFAANDVLGAETMYLNMPEFGFSKTLEETLEKWGEEELLRKMVRAIRAARPDVIITNHGTLKDHGHHQAVGYILPAAFDAAADPGQFPEQLAEEGLEPWQAQRLYFRLWGETDEGVVVEFDELEPASGKTYAEIAAKALDQHNSQGMEFFINRYLAGGVHARYKLIREALHETDSDVPAPGGVLFEGIQDRMHPDLRRLSESAGGLEETLQMLSEHGSAGPRGNEALHRLAAIQAGLRIRVAMEDDTIIPGQRIEARAAIDSFRGLTGDSAGWEMDPVFEFGEQQVLFNGDGTLSAALAGTAGESIGLTLPLADHVYADDFLQPNIAVRASITVNEQEVRLVERLYADVALPALIEPLTERVLVRRGADSNVTASFAATWYAPEPGEAAMTFEAPWANALAQDQQRVRFQKEDEQRIVAANLKVPNDVKAGDYTLTAAASALGHTSEAEVLVRVADVEVPSNIRAGVIRSYDDTYTDTLGMFGVEHALIGAGDFNQETLGAFDAIIVDIRAYRVRPDLVANNAALLDYVEHGGTLIVSYQKTFEWSEDFAPYPLTLSRNRVTVEEAPIEVLVPEHPFFHTPNQLGPETWNHWRQERGLYFPARWDDAYTALIDTDDPGEDIPPGSCLVAEYGEGIYFYTALGWYRQLRELHPGALRAFANMLALGQATDEPFAK